MFKIIASNTSIKLKTRINSNIPKLEVVIKKFDIPIKSDSKDITLVSQHENPTGTHKDFLAINILRAYFFYIEKNGSCNLPKVSILSSGSASVAINTALLSCGLPALHCLVSELTPPEEIQKLQNQGIKVFPIELGELELTRENILEKTQNPHGWEITSFTHPPYSEFDKYTVYGFLAYEVLFKKPDVIFMPYGSGLLFENFIKHANTIFSHSLHKVTIIGITAKNQDDPLAPKLYAPYRPFSDTFPNGYGESINNHSRIMTVDHLDSKNAYSLLKKKGIPSEPSATAGLAGFININTHHPDLIKGKKVCIIATGKLKAVEVMGSLKPRTSQPAHNLPQELQEHQQHHIPPQQQDQADTVD